ncbi:hypothetical protein BDQ17DRAFT_1334941 [Cyathus striatus]|nr:hypothetical protein BDQ17DRAFT_1334941 [Cyathus striatus]
MFGSAMNFVIQSGATFIDMDAKNVYYRMSSRGNFNTSHQDDSQILSKCDYKKIKKGDVNVIEHINGPVQKGNLYDDFIVEVSGENKRKVAQIYNGRRGRVQLKKELEMLSKMCVPQVFGMYKSNNTVGLVFHGDGIYQRCSEYMQSLQPLQRAAFYIQYVSHYIDTLEYLCQHIQSLRTGPTIENKNVGIMEDKVALPAQQGILNFYVDSHGTLKSVVSNSIISQPHFSMAQVISACYDAFLSVIQTEDIYMSQKSECYIGHPVILHWNYHYIHYILGHVKIIQRNFDSSSWFCSSNLFYQETSYLNHLTCFKLSSYAVTAFKNADHHESISIVENYHITEDTYHDWLHEASQILEEHAFIPVIHNINDTKRNYLGIAQSNCPKVSSVEIYIEITTFFSAILHYVENNKDAEVDLFISDPGIDPVDGMVLEPHIFWSLEKSGAKPLTEFSATLIGLSACANVAMTLKISYWDKFYYEALRGLYKMCGLTTSDVSRHIGRSELKSSIQGI